ncbi:isochorismatase family cysteine hydrolase [Sphingomonas sp. VNH70]|uniref:cysteine hydrolase family protein n=1 Tax=Sphingomonas silueang TaxID=3156617 RepID=UPI0032B562F7
MADLILVVDTQADFMLADGALPVPGADAVVAPLRAWLGARAAADTAAVLFTFDTHDADTYPDSAEAKLFPIHCVRDTPGWRNLLGCAAVPPGVRCATIEKGVFDMWAEDGLMVHEPDRTVPRETWFAELRDAGVDHAIVVGVAADYCVAQAIAGLVARGFRVTVPRALTRGITRAIDRVVSDDFNDMPVAVVDLPTPVRIDTSPWS